MRYPILAGLVLALSAAGCDRTDHSNQAANIRAEGNEAKGNPTQPARATPSVTGAVLQLPAAPGRPGAAYFTIEPGTKPARLVSISSDAAKRIELHETKMEGNIMRMGPLSDNLIRPGAPLRFEQGGKHAMLFDLDPAIKPGDVVKLTFNFEPGGAVVADAQVRAFGGGHNGH